MDVQTVYGNFIRVDGRMLTAADGEQLEELLTTHNQFVTGKIEALEAKMRANNPSLLIQPPRMWVMYLGPREEVIRKSSTEADGDIFRSRSTISPAFWPLWDIVVASDGFVPEVRWGSAVMNNPAGAYLLMRLF